MLFGENFRGSHHGGLETVVHCGEQANEGDDGFTASHVAMQQPGVFVGSFLIETFFSIPGLGREILLAVNRSDYPVIQAVTIYLAVLTMLINLTADILYRAVDPRVVLK